MRKERLKNEKHCPFFFYLFPHTSLMGDVFNRSVGNTYHRKFHTPRKPINRLALQVS